jgi:hypothetical protein
MLDHQFNQGVHVSLEGKLGQLVVIFGQVTPASLMCKESPKALILFVELTPVGEKSGIACGCT